MINFLDTSAILNGALNNFTNIYISPIVIEELESIKTANNRDDNIKYKAREAVRTIIASSSYQVFYPNQQKVDKMLQKFSFLSNINDHRLLAEALLLKRHARQDVNFVTSDGALFLFSKQIKNLYSFFFEPQNEKKEEYLGWKQLNPTADEFNKIYTDPQNNLFKCNTNEYISLYENKELKDILVWTGKNYRPLNYHNIKNKFLNETICPRNTEQKMAFDLLQNTKIPVKFLTGKPGSGKDFLMLLHALDLIQKGEMEKIVFIRNLVPFKDAPEIGFLSGDLQSKIAWGLGPITSILGEEGLAQYQEQGIIEAVNLGFIRGCSWNNTILYVSEGQNITGGGYKLLISRCGEGSQLWVNGDILQTDEKRFERNNGLFRTISALKGNELFGAVKLMRTERSRTAELAAII